MRARVNKDWKRPAIEWRDKYLELPTTIVADCLGRYMGMNGELRPIFTDIHLCGFALTIRSMIGNNLMSHLALTFAQKGDVLVIDAGGCTKNAVWGDIQALCAQQKGVAGLVVDGAIRDIAEMRSKRFPVFCRSTTPNGPHKGWADCVNVAIQCGGVPVNPGDLVLGDDDGVVVVPKNSIEEVYKESLQRLKNEQEWVKQIKSGKNSLEAVGLEDILKSMEIEYDNE